jgi:OOP family OmpA-OmpF porin
VAVDQFGCPLKGSVTLEGVNFETNSATLTADSYPVLDQAAAGLVAHPRLRVELQGHTDSTGSKAYNMVLSGKRADAVREYLLHKGVNPQQLVSKGYGPTQPVADNTTKEGRAKNRRVVMEVLENPGDVDVKGAGTSAIQ